MEETVDWKNAPIEDLVAEYERRKGLPTIQDLYKAVGLTRQGFWARVQAYYAKNPDKAPQDAQKQSA